MNDTTQLSRLMRLVYSFKDIFFHTLLGLALALVLLTVGQVSPILGGVVGAV